MREAGRVKVARRASRAYLVRPAEAGREASIGLTRGGFGG
jgi:hypothetical protein